MGAPVTCVIVPIVTAISALVRLRFDVHVHPVVVHRHPAHESLATVFAVEPLVRVCHVHPLHMVFHIFHNHPTDFTRRRAVDFSLVQLQVSIFEHLSTIGTRHHHSLVSNLSVVVQLVRVVSFETTGVAHVLLRVLGHVLLQRLLGFTTDQTAILFTGQPAFMLDPDVPLYFQSMLRCRTWPSRVVSLGTSGHSQFQASTLCQNWCFSSSALPVFPFF